jgi:hypothetical protein
VLPLVKVFAGQTQLVCIASRVAGTLFHPKVVLVGGRPSCNDAAVTLVIWLIFHTRCLT